MDIIAALLAGILIGWILRTLTAPPPSSGRYENRAVWINAGPSESLILRSVTNDKLRALAARWSRGEPLTHRKLTGRGRLFTRLEWDNIRQELIDRRTLHGRPRRAAPPHRER